MTIVTHPDFQIIKLTVSIVNDNNNITTTTNDGKDEKIITNLLKYQLKMLKKFIL